MIESTTPEARRAGYVHSVAAALCSAGYLFPYKSAARLAAPGVLAYALLIVAALSSSALSLWQLRRGPGPRWDRTFWTTSSALALLAISGNLCGAQAVSRLEPAIASLLLRTEIVFVGALGALILGERVSGGLMAGAALALGGLAVMRWPLALDQAGTGALWALGGAASFGLMQVLTRRVIGGISPVAVNTCRLWIAVALWSLLPGVVSGALTRGGDFWALVALAGLLGPFLGRLLIMYSLRSLRAAHSALLLLLAPVFAFLIGYVGYGSVPRGAELVGGALMLVGIALPSLARPADE
ncbi:MAG TPA: DMT family transporter [Polyangiaceae bacterium]|nr:DMT family transporter [Polyangiaceae bacterium]